MLNTTITRSFSPSVAMSDNESIKYQVSLSDAPTSNPGYLICIASNGKERHLIIPYAPSERYLLALSDFIRASIPTLQPDRMGSSWWMVLNECIMIETAIKRFCYPLIEEDSFDMLARGEVTADHAYIGVAFKKSRKSPLNGHVVVSLYKNGELWRALNSLELEVWLKRNPETPIYKSECIEVVAAAILESVGLDEDEVTHRQVKDDCYTRSQVISTKLTPYENRDLVFTKKGVEVHGELPAKTLHSYILQSSIA